MQTNIIKSKIAPSKNNFWYDLNTDTLKVFRYNNWIPTYKESQKINNYSENNNTSTIHIKENNSEGIYTFKPALVSFVTNSSGKKTSFIMNPVEVLITTDVFRWNGENVQTDKSYETLFSLLKLQKYKYLDEIDKLRLNAYKFHIDIPNRVFTVSIGQSVNIDFTSNFDITSVSNIGIAFDRSVSPSEYTIQQTTSKSFRLTINSIQYSNILYFYLKDNPSIKSDLLYIVAAGPVTIPKYSFVTKTLGDYIHILMLADNYVGMPFTQMNLIMNGSIVESRSSYPIKKDIYLEKYYNYTTFEEFIIYKGAFDEAQNIKIDCNFMGKNVSFIIKQ